MFTFSFVNMVFYSNSNLKFTNFQVMIVIIHTFKLRYLNYYEEILVEESKKAEPKKVETTRGTITKYHCDLDD